MSHSWSICCAFLIPYLILDVYSGFNLCYFLILELDGLLNKLKVTTYSKNCVEDNSYFVNVKSSNLHGAKRFLFT